MATSPFDWLNSICETKENLLEKEVPVSEYVPFMVNRGLSQHADTAEVAQYMNRNHHLDKDMQYHFLLLTVPKRRRRGKWAKAEKNDDVDLVARFYGYNRRLAASALKLLTPEQLKVIKSLSD